MMKGDTQQQIGPDPRTEPSPERSRREGRRTYLCFADLLDYPGPDLADQARTCADLLAPDHPPVLSGGPREAAGRLQGFLDFVESTPLGRLEEIYTATFDVNPACYIFAGYLLFGESFKRGKFLVRLQEKYRERGFSAGNELADHLPVLFRFLATLDPEEVLAQELVGDCLIPVLQKMNASFKNDADKPNPYAQVLRAILARLEQDQTLIRP
jgi:nitrate reductase delta subunit